MGVTGNIKVVFRRSRFVVEYRDEFGKRPRPSFKTEIEAFEFARSLRAPTHESAKVESPPPIRAGGTTLKEAIKKYRIIAETRQQRSTFNSTEKYYFEKLFMWMVNERSIVDVGSVTRLDMEEFRASLRRGTDEPGGSARAASTVNRMMTSYRSFFNRCVDWEIIKESPMAKMKPLAEEPAKIGTWRVDQIQMFIQKLHPWMAEFEFFCSRTGRRPIDGERLNWGDVNLTDKIFRVVTYKGREPFADWFPMSDDVAELLSEIHSRAVFKNRAALADPVFLNYRGGRVNARSLYKAFVAVRDQCGLRGLKPYWVRHSFADALVDMGVHPRDIQKLMGHKNFATTTKYTDRKVSHLKLIVDRHSLERKVAL